MNGSDLKAISQSVAEKIYSLRASKNLSLNDLSYRSGVSKGMLVEIEKGTANPSIAILCKISSALGVSVADIIKVNDSPTSYIIEKDSIPMLWNGLNGGSAKLLAGTSGPDMIELWRWEINPGEEFKSSGHPQGTIELIHVESGILTFLIGSEEILVSTGCSIVAKTDKKHSYINNSNVKLVFFMTVIEINSTKNEKISR